MTNETVIDWLMENLMPWVVMALLAVVLFGFFVGVPVAYVRDMEQRERFMAECQADGRERYECEAMLRGGRR